jgi:hypothetical protein
MTRSTPRQRRRPKADRPAQTSATHVFRDFVRQLERLDLRPRKLSREGAR